MEAPKKLKGSKNARLSMARLAATQCVYQWLQAGAPAKDILAYYEDYFSGLKMGDEEFLPPDQALLPSLLQGVQSHFLDLDNIVNQHISKKSEGIDSKKDMLVLSILYCGVYELMFHTDTDAPLVISDYLHVTKSFYEGSEVKLVNAILDAVKKTLGR